MIVRAGAEWLRAVLRSPELCCSRLGLALSATKDWRVVEACRVWLDNIEWAAVRICSSSPANWRHC